MSRCRPAGRIQTLLLLHVLLCGAGRAVAAEPVNEWSTRTSELAAAAGMSPFRTPLTLALVHLAVYDAVNAIEGGYAPYASAPQVRRPASRDAALVEAAYAVLLVELPSQRAALDAARAASLASIGEPELTNGLAVGSAAARALLARRSGDGRDATVAYTPGSGPGVWIPTPPGLLPAAAPFLARVVPFTLRAPSQFRPEGPPRLGSRRYARELREVKDLGEKDSASRSEEQTATAHFWEPFAGTVWPVSIRRVAEERGLDTAAAARFEAAAFAGFADAIIACWDAKYAYNFWRPVTAIRGAATDSNPRTHAKETWEPLSVTPPFPEYPSGHACVSTAVANVMEDFFSHDLRIPARNLTTGEERVYTRAQEVSDEVIEARMLLGVHFRTANEDGTEIGRRVARWIRTRFFRPTRNTD